MDTILVTVGKRTYVARRRIGGDNHFGAIAEVLSEGNQKLIAAGVEIALSATKGEITLPLAKPAEAPTQKPTEKGRAK